MKEYKVIVKEVLKFRGGETVERTIFDTSTSKLGSTREDDPPTEVTLQELLDDVSHWADENKR